MKRTVVYSARVPSWTALLVALVAAALSPACAPDLDIPEGPDLAPLAERYDEPSTELEFRWGPLASQSLAPYVDDVLRVEQLDLVRQLLQEFASIDLDRNRRVPKAFERQMDFIAVADLEKRCRGPEGTRKGKLVLNGVLEEQGLRRTMWGRLFRCGLRMELNGKVALRFDGQLDHIPLGALSATSYVIRFDGSVTEPGGTELHTEVHFRVLPPDDLALLLELEDVGSLVIEMPRDALEADEIDARFVDRRGVWSCQINRTNHEGTCVDEADIRPAFSF